MRQPAFPALLAVLIGATASVVSSRGQDGTGMSTMSAVHLPGGAQAALSAIPDPGPVDRAHLLVEVIRRAHESPMGLKGTIPRRDAVLRPLLAHLDSLASASGQLERNTQTADTLPLPLSQSVWINVILGGRGTADTLVADILRSPSAALLYCALLSLDDRTRAWMASQSELLAEIAAKHAAAFLVASPAVQFDGQRLRVPGGEAARPIWESLTGRPSNDASFVRALVSERDGRLAYFFAAMASLTPAQISFALDLDSPDPAVRLDEARRLFGVFQRIAEGWKMDDRPFWRPSLDPALLVSDLATTSAGRPWLPGNRAFWTTVLDDGGPDREISVSAEADLLRSEPVDFAWLVDQVLRGGQAVQRRPYHVVLFASRNVKEVRRDNLRDAVTALRAASAYPALITALERSGLNDVATYARIVRRAKQLSDGRRVQAVAQFSGALAFLGRAAARGSLTTETFSAAVSSLADVELTDRGEYDGRLMRWFETLVASAQNATAATAATASGASAPRANDPVDAVYHDAVTPLDRQTLRLMGGESALAPRTVEWEGTHYRLDFAYAELTRLIRVLGEETRPYLSSASGLLDIADALRQTTLTAEGLQEQAAAMARIDAALRCGAADNWESSNALKRCRELSTALERAAKSGDPASRDRLVPRLRALADDLLARGLMELAYAGALGQPEAAPIAASDAASRHDFGLHAVGFGSSGPWRFPAAGADRTHDWHVTGSLLGLDVRLAHFSLLRLTSKPPASRPSINDEDRRGVIESVALVAPHRLADADLQAIAAAIKKGRARAAAIRTEADAELAATEIPLAPIRRTLLKWVAANDPERVAAFLSPTELLVLGGGPLNPRLNAFGVTAEPRLGCLCLQLLSPSVTDRLSGRWYSGIFATGFGDLPLRLGELLTELRMPAALLAPVLASAALEFITKVKFRDADDRRGLVEFVHSLRVDNMEQYLALLTTDGPLVPIAEGTGHAQAGLVLRSFVLLH